MSKEKLTLTLAKKHLEDYRAEIKQMDGIIKEKDKMIVTLRNNERILQSQLNAAMKVMSDVIKVCPQQIGTLLVNNKLNEGDK